jgi:peptide methionine sulfoxide reductase MsrA
VLVIPVAPLILLLITRLTLYIDAGVVTTSVGYTGGSFNSLAHYKTHLVYIVAGVVTTNVGYTGGSSDSPSYYR